MKHPPPPPDRESLLQLPKAQLVDMMLRLLDQIQMLTERIEQLEQRRATDSQTSSKPPSTDLLTKPEQTLEADPAERERKPGGQPGHRGKTRKGFRSVDRFEVLQPQACPHCGSSQLQVIHTQKQQVACLVERPIEVVEYVRHTCQCQGCGEHLLPDGPQQIISGQDMDVRLQGLLAWLGNCAHLPYEKQQELLQEWSGQLWSVGTLVNVNERVAAAVAPSVEAAWQQLPREAVVYVDETPWPVKGVKEWLWHVGTEKVSLFHAGDSRSRSELEACLGDEFAGCLVSDDYSVYNGYGAAAQQKCLAHLRRHCKRLEKFGHGVQRRIGTVFKTLLA